jgi:ABC-type amino acid transport substrate-binding protein
LLPRSVARDRNSQTGRKCQQFAAWYLVSRAAVRRLAAIATFVYGSQSMRNIARVGWLAGILLMALAVTVACGSTVSGPAAPLAAQSTKLRLASTKWVPFTGAEGEPRVALTLTESALQRAGYESTTAIVPDGQLTPKLQHGEYDGSAALWRSEDREQFLLYSKAYLENRLVLVARKGSDVSARSLKELKGKTVALVEGYAYGEAVDYATETRFVRGSSAHENLQALLAGKIDYVLLEELVVAYLFEQHAKEATARLEAGKVPLLTRTLHFAVRKGLPDAQRIIDRFNDAIASMVGDGSYNQALQLDWIRADVDGDGHEELISRANHLGSAPPERSYSLFSPATVAAATASVSPATTPATASAGGARLQPDEPHMRFFIAGKYYDSWQEVPEKLRGEAEPNYVAGGKTPLLTVDW